VVDVTISLDINLKKARFPHCIIEMTEETGQNLARLPTKGEIIAEAKKGMFNSNPLLTTPHEVVCKECGYRRNIVFLDYVRSGAFELGKTEMVEVVHAAPTFTGLGQTLERMTPLIIRVKCERCGAETAYSPLSLEYLLFTTQRNDSSTFYI
jgi:DNA-directed RNA polymerase subunit RPC12/RpoP